jgi:hypothetical protein
VLFIFIWNSKTVAGWDCGVLVDYLDSLVVASLPCVCVVVICLFSSLIAAVTKRERLKSK